MAATSRTTATTGSGRPALLALALALFTALAAAVETDRAVPAWDEDVHRWLDREQPQAVTAAARVVTAAGGGVFLLALVAATAVTLLRRGRRVAAVYVAVAYVLTQGTTNLLKLVFERPRPEFRADVDVSTFAFPSGHASVSLAVYGALAVLLLPHARGRLRPALVGAAVAIVLAVGLSRVALGVHYASDVAAGLALGAACLLLCTAAASRAAGGPPG